METETINRQQAPSELHEAGLRDIEADCFEAICNLVHATSDDVTRHQLMTVAIWEGRAYATDGHIAVWTTVHDCLKGLDVCIPAETLKKLRKERFVRISDKVVVASGVTYTLEVNNQYRHPIKTIWQTFREYSEPASLEYVGFNPVLLARIAKALGLKKGKGLKLRFKSKDDMIQVYSPSGGSDEMLAVLMPMRI